MKNLILMTMTLCFQYQVHAMTEPYSAKGGGLAVGFEEVAAELQKQAYEYALQDLVNNANGVCHVNHQSWIGYFHYPIDAKINVSQGTFFGGDTMVGVQLSAEFTCAPWDFSFVAEGANEPMPDRQQALGQARYLAHEKAKMTCGSKIAQRVSDYEMKSLTFHPYYVFSVSARFICID
jgi:hypothetical protein